MEERSYLGADKWTRTGCQHGKRRRGNGNRRPVEAAASRQAKQAKHSVLIPESKLPWDRSAGSGTSRRSTNETTRSDAAPTRLRAAGCGENEPRVRTRISGRSRGASGSPVDPTPSSVEVGCVLGDMAVGMNGRGSAGDEQRSPEGRDRPAAPGGRRTSVPPAQERPGTRRARRQRPDGGLGRNAAKRPRRGGPASRSLAMPWQRVGDAGSATAPCSPVRGYRRLRPPTLRRPGTSRGCPRPRRRRASPAGPGCGSRSSPAASACLTGHSG
jgi:hypothetical protein